MKKHLLFLPSFLFSFLLFSQVVPEPTSNTGIYTFLDEMANLKIIGLNDVVKPYSRMTIYNKLKEIEEATILSETKPSDSLKQKPNYLNKRQRNELNFYLQAYCLESDKVPNWPDKGNVLKKSKYFATAFNPPGVFYKDSVFTAAFQIIYGASMTMNENGNLNYTYGGASLFGYLGKNLSFYTNVRDNNMSEIMISPKYLTRTQGVPYKDFGEEGIDFSEARGGLTYAWKWGSVGLVKDQPEWGTGYHGTNIQSGHAPSFAMIKLRLNPARWFDFNYYHGFLSSDVVDSSRSYWSNDTYRIVYYQKYMAANMFTFYPFKGFNFSIGNSIIYTNESGGGPLAAYLIPFLFYKSVDITLSSYEKFGYASNNNHFFFNISSRNIKHLHLYFSLFADDISVRYFSDPNQYNSFSYKMGFRLSDYLLSNTRFTFEYTHTNPYVFQHHAETQNYTSNSYNMGHYLRDNSDEIYIAIGYTPIRGLDFDLSYTIARHGDDYDINDSDAKVHSDPFMENITWKNISYTFRASYQFVSNAYLFVNYQYRNITGEQDSYQKFTPELYWGETNSFSVGFNLGL